MAPHYEFTPLTTGLAIVAAISVGLFHTPRSQGQEEVALFSPSGVRLFTAEDLKRVADERRETLLLLTVVGKVYNVTAGRKYYGVGEGYEGFAAGRDASRAFVDTTLFEREGVDDLANLTLSECKGVEHWSNFYAKHEEYTFAGVHVGNFFDVDGEPTAARLDFEACVTNANAVVEVLKGFVAKADSSGKGVCTWQHHDPKFVECEPPLAPLRFEIPDQGMVCKCVDGAALKSAVQATASRAAGSLEPRAYAECTLEQSRCMLPSLNKKAAPKQD
eukprot:scaffold8236_cov123-Isochrysis_galbana.AAC.4